MGVTYSTKMRWYKIFVRILLMLSVIDFALAAPVVVQKHEVRVSVVDAAKDGTATLPLRRDPSDKWLANAADRTNALPILRSSRSDHWMEQEPRQHNPRSRTESNGSPEPSNPALPIDPYANNPRGPSPPPGPGSTSPSPTSQAPTDEPDPLNPSPPHDDSHALNPASPSDSRPLRPGPSHDDLNLNSFPPSSSLRFKYLSELMSTPTHDTHPPDGSPPIASSPDESHSLSSWVPTDSHSGSWSSQHHVSPPASSPGSSQGRVPSPPNLGGHLPSDSHSWSSGLAPEESHPSSLDRSSPDKNNPSSLDQLSTDESHPPTPGPTHNHRPPASPSNPGSSTGPHPLQTAHSPDDDSSMADLDTLLKTPFLSAEEYHPPSLGPTDNHPPPASPSNPGPSTGPHPPPSAQSPHEDSETTDLEKVLKSPFLSTEEYHPPTPGPTHNHRPPASPSNPGPSTGPHALPTAQSPHEDSEMVDLEHPPPAVPSNPRPLIGLHTLPSAQSPDEDSSMADLDTLLKTPFLSAEEYHSPSLGPTDNHPPPASPSSPGPSTGPHPPPSAELPHKDSAKFMTNLEKLLKSPFLRPRMSGSGA